jgi:hypothetical protein
VFAAVGSICAAIQPPVALPALWRPLAAAAATADNCSEACALLSVLSQACQSSLNTAGLALIVQTVATGLLVTACIANEDYSGALGDGIQVGRQWVCPWRGSGGGGSIKAGKLLCDCQLVLWWVGVRACMRACVNQNYRKGLGDGLQAGLLKHTERRAGGRGRGGT